MHAKLYKSNTFEAEADDETFLCIFVPFLPDAAFGGNQFFILFREAIETGAADARFAFDDEAQADGQFADAFLICFDRGETRVACEIKSRLLLQDTDYGERRRQHRRLGILGQGQIRLRPFPHQMRQLLRKRVVNLLKNFASGGECVSERLAHADGLTSLAGKNECAGHGQDT